MDNRSAPDTNRPPWDTGDQIVEVPGSPWTAALPPVSNAHDAGVWLATARDDETGDRMQVLVSLVERGWEVDVGNGSGCTDDPYWKLEGGLLRAVVGVVSFDWATAVRLAFGLGVTLPPLPVEQLSAVQQAIIGYLRESTEPQRQGQIAEAIGYAQSTVSKALGQLNAPWIVQVGNFYSIPIPLNKMASDEQEGFS